PRLLRLLWRPAPAVRGVLRRLQHRRLHGTVADSGAMYARGDPFAPRLPDPDLARTGPGDGLRSRWRLIAESLRLQASLGNRAVLHRAGRFDSVELLDELRRGGQGRQEPRRLGARRRKLPEGEAPPALRPFDVQSGV